MQIETEVKTYRIECQCDSCRKGNMVNDGTVFLSNPPQYPHICTNCKAIKTFNVQYPRIEYKQTHYSSETGVTWATAETPKWILDRAKETDKTIERMRSGRTLWQRLKTLFSK